MDSEEFQFLEYVWINIPIRRGFKYWPAYVLKTTPQTVSVLCFDTGEEIDVPKRQVVPFYFDDWSSAAKKIVALVKSRNWLPRHKTQTQLIASKLKVKYQGIMKRQSTSRLSKVSNLKDSRLSHPANQPGTMEVEDCPPSTSRVPSPQMSPVAHYSATSVAAPVAASDDDDEDMTDVPASPIQPRAASPIQPRAASPIQPRAASPIQPRAASPIQPRAASPIQPRAASPIQPRAASPIQPRAASPLPSPPNSEDKNEPSSSYDLEDINVPSCSYNLRSRAIKDPIPYSYNLRSRAIKDTQTNPVTKRSIRSPPCRTHGH